MIKNPLDEELFSELVALDKNVMEKANKTYLQFRKKHKTNPNFIMQLTNYFKTNIALATLLGFTLIGTIGASAAELLSPQEYKPSQIINNLFEANKQVDTENNIIRVNNFNNLEKCNIPIKYPKKVKDKEIEYTQFFQPKDQQNNGTSNLEFDTYDFYFEKIKDQKEYLLSFKCYNQKPVISDSTAKEIISQKNLTKDELQKMTGWLTTNTDIQNIQILTVNFPETGVYNIKKIVFEYKDKYYELSKYDQTNSEIKFDFNDIQVQFTSTTNSSPELDKSTPKNNPNSTIIVVDKYDLALKVLQKDVDIYYNDFNRNKGVGPGISFELTYKGQKIPIRYYCPADTTSDWTIKNKPTELLSSELAFWENFRGAKSELLSQPSFFASESYSKISSTHKLASKTTTEVPVNNKNEYINKPYYDLMYFYQFESGNHCYLTITSENFQIAELEKVLSENLKLSIVSVNKQVATTEIKK